MTLPSQRLCIPFRLTQLPPEVRFIGARKAMRMWPDDAQEMLFVALVPSDRTYWLTESAKPLLEKWAA